VEKEQFDKIWKALKIMDDRICWLISQHPNFVDPHQDISEMRKNIDDIGAVEFVPPKGEEVEKNLVCPFCGTEFLGLIGMKSHIEMGHCDGYNNTKEVETIPKPPKES